MNSMHNRVRKMVKAMSVHLLKGQLITHIFSTASSEARASVLSHIMTSFEPQIIKSFCSYRMKHL